MASPPPPTAGSPLAMSMSPPNPTPAQLPGKKRSSTLDIHSAPSKRRKPSQSTSNAPSQSHPLRQTSFPPEAQSPGVRSPSVDTMSHVSGSQVSGLTAAGARKKKRGRKAKNAAGGGSGNANGDDAEATSSLVGGKASTSVAGGAGDKDGAAAGEDDDEDDNQEMALEDVVARTQEQKQEEVRLRAMLVEAFDSEQYSRYEHWRAAKLSDAVVKRVVNATVSQSVPQMVSTAVKAVAKLFAGEIIEASRQVQLELIRAGEDQSELPDPNRPRPHYDPRRGPLRPEHLREAWRRYRLSGESRGVGVQQMWHAQARNGVDRFSTRTGKRLFK
ncbi:hypothetical protein GMORB2_2722 [Geosmithia morbida]|uniref:TAFII28-like protein domain-containing protein n=1 Tax=Geosmithia morbida TaxID=1094350 RepID=A0A9P4YS49_9HYPO|nr:uncharacterized protein GMORB2_2722 [Geosmithia morbida]KAF4120718.1 hypothetical protein GMORB2_2722 [Geosmithia morbida]